MDCFFLPVLVKASSLVLISIQYVLCCEYTLLFLMHVACWKESVIWLVFLLYKVKSSRQRHLRKARTSQWESSDSETESAQAVVRRKSKTEESDDDDWERYYMCVCVVSEIATYNLLRLLVLFK